MPTQTSPTLSSYGKIMMRKTNAQKVSKTIQNPHHNSFIINHLSQNCTKTKVRNNLFPSSTSLLSIHQYDFRQPNPQTISELCTHHQHSLHAPNQNHTSSHRHELRLMCTKRREGTADTQRHLTRLCQLCRCQCHYTVQRGVSFAPSVTQHRSRRWLRFAYSRLRSVLSISSPAALSPIIHSGHNRTHIFSTAHGGRYVFYEHALCQLYYVGTSYTSCCISRLALL